MVIMEAIFMSGFLCWDCFKNEDDTVLLFFYNRMSLPLIAASLVMPNPLPSLQSQNLEDLATRCINEKGYLKLEHGLFFRTAAILGNTLYTVIVSCTVIPYSLKNFGFVSRVRTKGLRFRTIVIFTIIWLLLFIINLIQIRQDQRNVAHYSDQPDEESQWGFGQVSAVCAWLPLVHTDMIETFGVWSERAL